MQQAKLAFGMQQAKLNELICLRYIKECFPEGKDNCLQCVLRQILTSALSCLVSGTAEPVVETT